MKVEFIDVIVIVGWAVAIASILLQSLYIRPLVTWFEFTLLFLVSSLSGALLENLETVVVGFVGAFVLAVIIAYSFLTLPSLLGIAGVAGAALSTSAIVMVFRNAFPNTFVCVLLGGLFGSFIGERFKLR